MNIKIISRFPKLAESLKAKLNAQGFENILAYCDPDVQRYQLTYPRSTAIADLQPLLEQIDPFQPVSQRACDDDDITLYLGDEQPLERWNLSIASENKSYTDQLTQSFSRQNFCIEASKTGFFETDALVFGQAPLIVQHYIEWLIKQDPNRPGDAYLYLKKQFSDSDPDINLFVRDPEKVHLPANERFSVRIITDAPGKVADLRAKLRWQGFRDVAIVSFDEACIRPESVAKNSIDAGPLRGDYKPSLLKVQSAVGEFLEATDIDLSRFPVETSEHALDDGCPAEVTIQLPITRIEEGHVRPYAGSGADRFNVLIRSDCPTTKALLPELRAMGFYEVRFQHCEVDDGEATDSSSSGIDPDIPAFLRARKEKDKFGRRGFYIQFSEAMSDAADLKHRCETWLKKTLSDKGISLPVKTEAASSGIFARISDDDSHYDIELELPLASAQDGTLEKMLASFRDYKLKIMTRDRSGWEPLIEELSEAGFESVKVQSDHDESHVDIKYGGLHALALSRLRAILGNHTQARVKDSKEWSSSDHDVWLYLPKSKSLQGREPIKGNSEALMRTSAWLEGVPKLADRPFIQVLPEEVLIGQVRVKKLGLANHPLTPRLEEFDRYCIDGTTANLLERIAHGFQRRELMLLEGETATSKTSAFAFYAALIEQPFYRINLNGHTDTGDLIGKYVPCTTSESSDTAAWHWQEGVIISAIKAPGICCYDEVNLAEPQIIERFNGLHEQNPKLIVTEHENELYGGHQFPIPQSFHLCATMNPAHYAGRSQLSPAFKSRWTGYRFVRRPDAAAYTAMLNLLVFGKQPSVTVSGVTYRSWQTTATYPALQALPDIAVLLEKLARFHYQVECITGSGLAELKGDELGADHHETYQFDRKVLMQLINALNEGITLQGLSVADSLRTVLKDHYLDRMRSEADQNTLLSIISAAGFESTACLSDLLSPALAAKQEGSAHVH